MLAFKPQKGSVFQLAFSPDGASIATSGMSPIVCVSDALTGKVRWHSDADLAIGLGLAYSADGTKLAVVSWDEVTILDMKTWEQINTLPGRGYAVTFTPDGNSIVTVDAVSRAGVAQTWITSGARNSIVSFSDFSTCNRLRYSPDGKLLAALSEHEMILTNSQGGEFIARGAGSKAAGVGALVFHPTEPLLVYSAGPKLIAYDLKAKAPVAKQTRSKKYIQEAAFTPDGRHLVTVSNDTTAVLWETAGWTPVREFAWDIGPLKTVAVAPDGSRAACASDRGRVVVWDLDL